MTLTPPEEEIEQILESYALWYFSMNDQGRDLDRYMDKAEAKAALLAYTRREQVRYHVAGLEALRSGDYRAPFTSTEEQIDAALEAERRKLSNE